MKCTCTCILNLECTLTIKYKTLMALTLSIHYMQTNRTTSLLKLHVSHVQPGFIELHVYIHVFVHVERITILTGTGSPSVSSLSL